MTNFIKSFLHFNIMSAMAKKIIFIASIICLFWSAKAEAATLYWYNSGADSAWSTLAGNWWTDIDHTAQSGALPASSDAVITLGTTGPSVNLDTWTTPASLNASATGITFTGTNTGPAITNLIGDVTFNGSTYGGCYIVGGSIGVLTITGNVTYNDSSYNCGHVTGNVTFNGSGYNRSSSGEITGNVVFNSTSYNQGTINGNVTFNGTSYNKASGSSVGIINGNATYNTTYHSTVAPTGGVYQIKTGNVWQGVVTGTVYGSDAQPITSWVFNGTSYIGSLSSVNGNATFKGTYYNTSAPSGGVFTVKTGISWNGKVIGTVYGTDDAPITSYVFNGTSSQKGDLTGNVTFNNTSRPLITYENSVVKGIITGNVTLNTTYYSGTTAPTSGVLTVNGSSLTTLRVNGNVYGSDAQPITSIVLNDDSQLNAWYGSFNGNITLNGFSYISPSLDSNYIYITGNVTTNDSSWVEVMNLTGDLVSNGNSVNSSSITGNLTMNNNGSMDNVSATGLITMNDTSHITSSSTGSIIFNDSSYMTTGAITGSATLYGDTTEINDTTVTGAKTRIYNTSTTTARNFAATGPWTVTADGAAVDISAATYNYLTTFVETNGGTFTPDPITLATITASDASGVTSTGATLTGEVVATGGGSITDQGFEYGLTTAYGQVASTTGTFSTGAFTQTLTSLTPSTTYHYRAFATNYPGTATSTDMTFTTSAEASPAAASTPSASGFIFMGNVSSLPGYIAPRLQTAYPDGRIVYHDETDNINSGDGNLAGKSENNNLTPDLTAGVQGVGTDNINSGDGNLAGKSKNNNYKFTRDLTAGAQGEDVKRLQKFLNGRGFLIAESGFGSPGKETTYFGRLTRLALVKFQKANSIYPALGYFGSITRKFLGN